MVKFKNQEILEKKPSKKICKENKLNENQINYSYHNQNRIFNRIIQEFSISLCVKKPNFGGHNSAFTWVKKIEN